MAVVQCNIYQNTNQMYKNLDNNASLSTVRAQLGSFMKPTYQFVYYDGHQQKQFMQPIETEANYKLSSILGAQNVMTITDPNAAKPDLEGLIVTWFKHKNLQVAISLNKSDATAVAMNKDKFEPFMLEKVQTIKDSANNFPNVYYENALICEKGSVIRFRYSCWGAAGYGFSIGSNRSTIVSALYVMNNGNYNTVRSSWLERYQSSKQNIVVDSLADQGIPLNQNLSYSSITFKAWNVSSYTQNGIPYSSNAQPPQRKTADLGGLASIDGIVMAGKGIESGSPHPGGDSSQNWSAPSYNIVETRNSPLGQMDIYFLVFKTKASAAQMVQQNNIIAM
jgi:hypothetical protein